MTKLPIFIIKYLVGSYKFIVGLVVLYSCASIAHEAHWNCEKAYGHLQNSYTEHGFQSIISTEKSMEDYEASSPEIFSTILILDLVQKQINAFVKNNALHYVKKNMGQEGPLHFFENRSLLPADVDSTALALVAMADVIDKSYAEILIRKIAENVTSEGIIQVYFNDTVSRKDIIDPVVCANALYALYTYNSSIDVSKTEDFLYKVLASEQYKEGTRYYPSPSTFFWAVSRLLKFKKFKTKFLNIFQEKIGTLMVETNPLDLAQYIIALKNACLPHSEQKKILAKLQKQDGSWDAWAFFKYGKQLKYFGSSQITTAFAICALEEE